MLVVIKTSQSLFTELEGEVKHLHPYEVPEIVGVKASNVNHPYLKWVMDTTKKP